MQIRGFTMPRISGYEALHELYTPLSRKKKFPEADWAFLLKVACNLAQAVEMVHAKGHVIGDLNQTNVLVNKDGHVALIDCDSYQIRAATGQLYLCEVGVREFTSPELLSLKSFVSQPRTPNHDNFALAVLIFHLLFFGRHPFAGKFRGPGNPDLGEHIAKYRYAYGSTASKRWMAPPPQTLPVTGMVPTSVANAFELAFGPSVSQVMGRPTAAEWVKLLSGVYAQLATCGQDSTHKYFRGLTNCPWCQSAKDHNVVHFPFNVQLAWQKINGVKRPQVVALPAYPRPEPTLFNLPPTIKEKHDRLKEINSKVAFLKHNLLRSKAWAVVSWSTGVGGATYLALRFFPNYYLIGTSIAAVILFLVLSAVIRAKQNTLTEISKEFGTLRNDLINQIRHGRGLCKNVVEQATERRNRDARHLTQPLDLFDETLKTLEQQYKHYTSLVKLRRRDSASLREMAQIELRLRQGPDELKAIVRRIPSSQRQASILKQIRDTDREIEAHLVILNSFNRLVPEDT